VRSVSVPASSRVGSTALFGVASVVANAMGYVLSVLLARGLSPDEFGAMGALLALGIIGTIPYTAVQLSVSRRATDALLRGERVSRGRALMLGLVVGLALCVGFVVVAVPLAAYLHLDTAWHVVVVGLILVPMLVGAAGNGVLLGEERITRLSVAAVTSALARVVAVGVALVGGGGVGWALVAMVVGATAATAVVVALVPGGGTAGIPLRAATRTLSSGAVVLTAYFLLTNVDVPIARHHLTGPDSGTYALSSIFTKICLWGPQFLAVVAFPRMHRSEGRSTSLGVAALTVVFGLGVSAALVPLGAPVVQLVAGRPVDEAASLAPFFGLLGTAWAVINVAVLHDIATRPRGRGGWVWAVTGAMVLALVLQPTPATVSSIVAWALGVSAVGAGVAIVRLVLDDRRSVLGYTVRPGAVEPLAQAHEEL
jgi:O-antigen/teichoic acid export membrane protein